MIYLSTIRSRKKKAPRISLLKGRLTARTADMRVMKHFSEKERFGGNAQSASTSRWLVALADFKSERNEIKRFGGKPQPNSGRGAVKKGDAILGPFVVDVKEYSKSYSISMDNWAKVNTDARVSGHYSPALNLVLGDPSSPRCRLWVIDDTMFKQMLEAWNEVYGEE